MCIKQVERELDFNSEIETLLSIDLKADIHYVEGEVGISALGYLIVMGTYKYSNYVREFEEMIEIDILAPYEKISDSDCYEIKIKDYDYFVKNGNLLLVIDLAIKGLQSEIKDDSYIEKAKSKMIIDMGSVKNEETARLKEENIKIIEDKIDDYASKNDHNISSAKLTSIVKRVIDENKDAKEVSTNEGIDTSLLSNVDVYDEVSLADALISTLNNVSEDIQISGDDLLSENTNIVKEIDDLSDTIDTSSNDDIINELMDDSDEISEEFQINIDFLNKDKDATLCIGNCQNPKIVEVEELYKNSDEVYEEYHDICDILPRCEIEIEKGNDDMIFDNFIFANSEEEFEDEPYDFFKDLDSLLEINNKDDDIFSKELKIMNDELLEEVDYKIYDNKELVENNDLDITQVSEIIDNEPADTLDTRDLIEDILSDDVNIMQSVRYVIVSRNDTYASLALKYQVDCKLLTSANHNKPILDKTLIEIPQ